MKIIEQGTDVRERFVAGIRVNCPVCRTIFEIEGMDDVDEIVLRDALLDERIRVSCPSCGEGITVIVPYDVDEEEDEDA